jgi:hypothetical protein
MDRLRTQRPSPTLLGTRVQFPLPPLFLNKRLVANLGVRSRLKPILSKSLRLVARTVIRDCERHLTTYRGRWVLPKALPGL